MKTWQLIPLFIAAIIGLALMITPAESKEPRFVDQGNGTVIDTRTGLLWTRNSSPLSAASWEEANSRAAAFRISGVSGWRLPGPDEFRVLLKGMKAEPHPFTHIQPWGYWTAKTDTENAASAWYLDMRHGDIPSGPKSTPMHIWPVRAIP